MRIRLLPEAERDLEIGADFYEAQSPGLGVYFSECLISDIESLKLYAGIHEKYMGLYRSLSLSLERISAFDLLQLERGMG